MTKSNAIILGAAALAFTADAEDKFQSSKISATERPTERCREKHPAKGKKKSKVWAD